MIDSTQIKNPEELVTEKGVQSDNLMVERQNLSEKQWQKSNENVFVNKDEEQWSRLRQTYFQKDESIKQKQKIIEIVVKWVHMRYGQQFQMYVQKLAPYHKDYKEQILKRIIEERLKNDKQNDWKISQKYNINQINNIVDAIRVSIKDEIEKVEKRNSRDSNFNINSSQLIERYANSRHSSQRKSQKLQQYENEYLPKLKHRSNNSQISNISSSVAMTYNSVFGHSLLQNQNETQPNHRNQLKLSKSSGISNIFSNNYLKMAYRHFCRQNYRVNYTFDIIAEAVDKMSLNKWMVFCKQFDFISKFSKKDVIEIFHICTSFASSMTLDQFLHAVALLQEKYITKFHTEPESFVGQVLGLTSEAEFRMKMANLKISYSGPRRNCFQYATYSEKAREQEKLQQKKFQMVKQERELILIKGMYEGHLKEQLKDLKLKRQQKKLLNGLNKTSLMNDPKQLKNLSNGNNSFKLSPRKKEPINYMKIFHYNTSVSKYKQRDEIKQSQNEQVTPIRREKSNKGSRNFISHNKSVLASKYQTKKDKYDQKQKQINKVEEKSMGMGLEVNQPRRQWLVPKMEESVWLTRLRSDSEQSDEILKEHLQTQKKKMNSSRGENIQPLVNQFQQKSMQVDEIRQQIEAQMAKQKHQDEQNDSEMMATQIQVSPKRSKRNHRLH